MRRGVERDGVKVGDVTDLVHALRTYVPAGHDVPAQVDGDGACECCDYCPRNAGSYVSGCRVTYNRSRVGERTMFGKTDQIDRARLLIEEVILVQKVDEAIALLMTEAEIITGDVAGQYFSEFDNLQDHWESLSADARAELLSRYLDTEAVFVAA
jgi:hypothetical protein